MLTKSTRKVVQPSGSTSVAFNPDGRLLASNDNKEAWVSGWKNSFYALEDSSCICTWKKGHSPTFSCDGSLLAYVLDHTIHLCETLSWQEISALVGHTGFVNSISFSPNGQYLASASYDGTIRIWKITSGQEVSAIVGHHGGVSSVAFSRDGNYLVSGGEDSSVRSWQWNAEAEKLSLIRSGGGSMALAASKANIEGVIGLTRANFRLLQQHGARGKVKSRR
jgi:WD40 repeat protein